MRQRSLCLSAIRWYLLSIKEPLEQRTGRNQEADSLMEQHWPVLSSYVSCSLAKSQLNFLKTLPFLTLVFQPWSLWPFVPVTTCMCTYRCFSWLRRPMGNTPSDDVTWEVSRLVGKRKHRGWKGKDGCGCRMAGLSGRRGGLLRALGSLQFWWDPIRNPPQGLLTASVSWIKKSVKYFYSLVNKLA